ncbi:MAG: hypothetical protein HKN12_08535, partial [Gemmatimonadetes bacterium]|nr:hypothetical protein [Gemmatimonadota bacterium]
ARDANTGALLPAVYSSDPVRGGEITVQLPADTVLVSGIALLPATLPVGTTDQAALRVVWTHPGGPDTAPVRLDSLTVLTRDGTQPVVPDFYVDRAAVKRGGAEVGVVTGLPTSGGAFGIPLGGVTLDPGATDTLEVRFDVEVTAPVTRFEMHVNASGLHLVDANTGAPVAAIADSGAVLPIVSGLAQIESPARELAVGFTDSMPAVLAADGSTVTFATLSLRNTAGASSGNLSLDRLEIRAGDADLNPQDIGRSLLRVEAWIDGALWAATADLTEADVTAVLTSPTALVLVPDAPVTVELRGVLRTGTAMPGLRLGLESAGVGVIQPGSPLLSVSVVAEPGQQFPFWTLSGSGAATTLEESWSNFPNPFAAGREETKFAFFLPDPGRVTLKVYTARGEEVRQLMQDQPLSAGLHQSTAWDGRNGIGESVVNGVYLAVIRVDFATGGSESYFRKVAVVR